ncbi:MAG: gliding motility-associated ABC transporter permease subunit GldF, partial [Bacteroidota bacterium]
ASSLTNNQITSFLLACFLCFLFYWGFDFFSRLPVFVGRIDDVVQMLGIDYHYESVSRGLIDSRDVLYFLSVIALFFGLTSLRLDARKW